MKRATDKTVTTSIKHCARCGENHKQILFTKLTRPHERHTHWAPCPVNGEPIMMIVLQDEPKAKKLPLGLTKKQKALVKAYGTPAEFAAAVYKAVPGDISMDEARQAVDNYNREWAAAA